MTFCIWYGCAWAAGFAAVGCCCADAGEEDAGRESNGVGAASFEVDECGGDGAAGSRSGVDLERALEGVAADREGTVATLSRDEVDSSRVHAPMVCGLFWGLCCDALVGCESVAAALFTSHQSDVPSGCRAPEPSIGVISRLRWSSFFSSLAATLAALMAPRTMKTMGRGS